MPKASENTSRDRLATTRWVTPNKAHPLLEEIPDKPLFFNIYGNSVSGDNKVGGGYVDRKFANHFSAVMKRYYGIITLYRIRVIPKHANHKTR